MRKVHPGQTFNMAAYAIGRSALATPDKPALIVVANADETTPSEVWTYARLERAVLAVAAAFRERGLVHLCLFANLLGGGPFVSLFCKELCCRSNDTFRGSFLRRFC